MESLFLALRLLTGCNGPDPVVNDTDTPADDTSPPDTDTSPIDTNDTSTQPLDSDGDGYTDDVDCASDNRNLYQLLSGFRDGDFDSYTAGDLINNICSGQDLPEGYAFNQKPEDCNDTDPAVSPDAEEVSNDNLDNDCDPSTINRLGETYGLADADFQGSATSENAKNGWSLGAADINADGFDELFIGAPQTAGTSGGGVYVMHGASSGLTTAGYNYMSGTTAGDLAGYSVANAGDMDGDGMEDVLVGAPAESTNATQAGVVYLVSGAAVATDTLDNLADAGSAIRMRGTSEYESVGGDINNIYDNAHGALASGGDIDGDGNLDVAIGAIGYNNYYGLLDQGAVYLVHGPVTGHLDLSTDADTIIEGLSATEDDPTSLSAYTGVGLSMDDLDGDGYADLLVGSSTDPNPGTDGPGQANLFYGPIPVGTIDINDSDVRIDGDPNGSDGDAFGGAGTLAADLDGDGYKDIVGCDRNENSVSGTLYGNGTCYLFSGATALGTLTAGIDQNTKWTGVDGAILGVAVTTGDYDGDGFDDLLIGASHNTGSTPGGGHLYYGPITAATLTEADADAFFEGENQADAAGTSVGTGDFNGDGRDDVSIGAPNYDWGYSSVTDAGRTYTFYGLGE